MNHYRTIERPSVAEFKDRGSRFLAYAFPVMSIEDFKKRLRELKEEHPKAAHHCFAYRIGIDGALFRSGDDGEPAGSAGKPILGQLDSKELTNVAVVVVRYFGGTLLGVPGLINAYKTTASLALQLTPIVQRPVLEVYAVQYEYNLMNEVMMVVKRFGCVVMENEMQLFCRMVVGVPKENVAMVTGKLNDLHGVETEKIKN